MRHRTLTLLVATLALLGSACGVAAADRPSQAADRAGGLAASEASPQSARWIPVAYRFAELSIPPSWYVLYNQPPCVVGGAPGELFVDPLPGVFHCPTVSGQVPSTVVTLEGLDPNIKPSTLALRIHGIVLLKAEVASPDIYLVPSLHLQIQLEGPLGFRVLETLELSPRHHVLTRGQLPRLPSGWRYVTFAGLRVALPATWPVSRTDIYGSDCSPLQWVEFFPPAGAVLDTDTHLLLPPCPLEPPGQPPKWPAEGIRIDERATWPSEPPSAFSKHCLRIHGLRVCPATTPAFSILVLRVTIPGRAHPVYVSIGLAGNGSMARTILYLLRPS